MYSYRLHCYTGNYLKYSSILQISMNVTTKVVAATIFAQTVREHSLAAAGLATHWMKTDNHAQVRFIVASK